MRDQYFQGIRRFFWGFGVPFLLFCSCLKLDLKKGQIRAKNYSHLELNLHEFLVQKSFLSSGNVTNTSKEFGVILRRNVPNRRENYVTKGPTN